MSRQVRGDEEGERERERGEGVEWGMIDWGKRGMREGKGEEGRRRRVRNSGGKEGEERGRE